MNKRSFSAKTKRVAGCLLLKLFLVGLILSISMPGIACAEDFPSRDIKLIVPLAPGGGVDVTARFFAQKVEKILGVPVSVVNNTAGGGVAAALSVIQAKPDGYTLFYAPTGTIITKGLLNPKLPYRHTDFTAICQVLVMPVTISVNPDAPWQSLKELVDYGKKNPGKLRASVGTAGGFMHVLTNLFTSTAGIEITSIPTKGGVTEIAALMGGHSEISTDSITKTINFLRAGKLRALVSTHKISGFPAIKTFEEEGYPGVNLKSWYGVFGSKALPKPIVIKLTEAFEKASKDPALREQLGKLLILTEYLGPEETSKMVVNEREVTQKILKKAGLIQ